MTVHFIGAGPGSADLITVRGLKQIQTASVVLYAGSLVPEAIVAAAAPDAFVMDTAPLNLDEIIEQIVDANSKGLDVARVHSGDPSIYGAVAEQMRRLDRLGVNYDVTPGVSAYAAAAAELKTELTLAGVSQTVIITRTSVRSSAMPEGESLAKLGESGATLAIHLSVNNLANIVRDLIPHYGLDGPVVIAYRVGWPDQKFIHGTLRDIRQKTKASGITRTALILVGHVLSPEKFDDSRLYAIDHTHILRPQKSGVT